MTMPDMNSILTCWCIECNRKQRNRSVNLDKCNILVRA